MNWIFNGEYFLHNDFHVDTLSNNTRVTDSIPDIPEKNEGMLLHDFNPHLLPSYNSLDCVKTIDWFLWDFDEFMSYFAV